MRHATALRMKLALRCLRSCPGSSTVLLKYSCGPDDVPAVRRFSNSSESACIKALDSGWLSKAATT